MPLHGVAIFKKREWARIAIKNKDGVVEKYVYIRMEVIPTKAHPRRPHMASVRPSPGNREHYMLTNDNLATGTRRVVFSWEICEPGFGPHPRRHVSVPVPGPLKGDLWESIEDVAARIEYRGAQDQLIPMEYLDQPDASRFNKLNKNKNLSAVGLALISSRSPVPAMLATRGALEDWE